MGQGGLCPGVNLKKVVMLGLAILSVRSLLLVREVERERDLRAAEAEEAQREQLLAERAERQKHRELIADKKLQEAKALQAAAHKRAWERDKRKREQKEEEERSAKDLAREGKARREEEGIHVHAVGDEVQAVAAEEDEDEDDLTGQTQEAVRRRHASEPKLDAGAGGRFVAAEGWSDDAPRRCDTWSDGPFHGNAKAQIQKAVWIQTHGNATASQWKRKREGEKLNIHRQDRYHHMAALVRLASGAVAATWQAAEDTEGEQTQHLRMSVSKDAGRSWRQSWQLNITRYGGAMWSPVPHVDSAGRLWVVYVESEGDCRRRSKPKNKWPVGGSLKITYCHDPEPTVTSLWETPRTIYGIEEDGWIPKMLSNRLIVTRDGEWMLPFWRENAMLAKELWPDAQEHCRTKDNAAGQRHTNTASAFASVLVSSDGGATWESRGRVRDAAFPEEDGWAGGLDTRITPLVENSVVELRDGGLLMLFRTRTGFIYQATSADRGFTWTEPAPTTLNDPGSKSQVIRLAPDGPLLLAFNDHKPGASRDANNTDVPLPRKCISVLSLAMSEDEGESWKRIGVLRGGKAPGLRFSYPWMLQMGCKVLVAYSKFYVTGFKYRENDRELGLRAVHVHL